MGGVSVFRLTSRGMTDHNFGESGQLTTSVEGALVAARAAAVQPQDERLLVVGDSIAVTANEAALMVTRFDLGNQVAPATPETPQIRTFPWTTSSPLDVNDGYPLNLRISVTCADPVRFAWNPPPSTSPTVVTHNGNQSECLMDRILYDWNWRIRGDVEVSSEAGSVFQSWSINISARLEVRYHSPQIWPKGVTNFYPQGYVLLLGYNDRMLGQGNVWWVGPPIRVGATGNVYWAGGMAVYPLSYDGPLHFEHVSVSVIKAPTDPYAIGPASKLFAIGSAGRVELDDIASSTGTYTEIWQKNGKTLRDAAGNPTLPVFKSVTLEDAGTYRSIIRNSRGSYTTPSILVGVVDTTNSRQVYGAIGKPVSIPAPVAGSGLTYQWLLNGKELVNSTHIAGAKSKTLTIRKVESGDVGIYACHVSNSDGGWGLTSAQTTLRLVDSVPIFDSFALPDGALLDSYSFDLRTHASIGTTKFRVSGLPRGLVVDAATGILSGAPALAGNFTVRVLASNPAGTADPLLLPLHIEGLPSGAAGSFTGVQTSQRLLANVTIAESGAYTAAVQMYWGRPIRKTFRGYMNRTGSLLSLDAKITAPTEYAAVGVPDFDLAFRLSGGELTLNTDYPMHKLVWNSRTLPATTFEGYYTAKYGSSDVDGFAGITISSSGRVTVQNRMLDGLSYVGSTIVSSSGIIPMFQWKPGRMGVVVGNLSIVPGPSIGSYAASVAGQVDWSYAKGTTFQLGPIWGGEKTLAVLGSRYLPPDVPSESGPLMFDLPDHSSNLRASWVDPATNAAGSQTGTLSNSNRIDWEISGFADGATRFGAVRFAPKTGLFSGSARLSVPNLVSIGDYSTSISFLGMTVRTEASSATATGQGLYIRSLRRLESDSKGQLVSRPAKAYGRVVLETNAH